MRAQLANFELGLGPEARRSPNKTWQKSRVCTASANSGRHSAKSMLATHDKWLSKSSGQFLDERLALVESRERDASRVYKEWSSSERAKANTHSLMQHRRQARRKAERAAGLRRASVAAHDEEDYVEPQAVKDWRKKKVQQMKTERRQKDEAMAELRREIALKEVERREKMLTRVATLKASTRARERQKKLNLRARHIERGLAQSKSKLSSRKRVQRPEQGAPLIAGGGTISLLTGSSVSRPTERALTAPLSKATLRSQSARQLKRLATNPLYTSCCQWTDTKFLDDAMVVLAKTASRVKGEEEAFDLDSSDNDSAMEGNGERQAMWKPAPCTGGKRLEGVRPAWSGGAITPRTRRNRCLARKARHAQCVKRHFAAQWSAAQSGDGESSSNAAISHADAKLLQAWGAATGAGVVAFDSEVLH